jgi:hypothetical protein
METTNGLELLDINITSNERAVLKAIARSEYQPVNGSEPAAFADTSAVWTRYLDDGLTPRSRPGVVASLSKKGLVWTNGNGRDAEIGLTELGFSIYKAVR